MKAPMKTIRHLRQSLRSPSLLSLLLVLLFLGMTPTIWTQYFPYFPPAATGSTGGTSMRNAAAATQTFADGVQRAADDWARRANGGLYQPQMFEVDFANALFQFQSLGQQFSSLAAMVRQAGKPRADNAVAELEAGLNIIGEVFTFLRNEYNAGTLDRNTIVRSCRALKDGMREWEREFKKNSSRLGVVW